MNNFYLENWKMVYEKVVALDVYDQYNKVYIEEITKYSVITYSIAILSSVIVLFVIIPLFNKNGRTLGKMFFKINVVDENYEKVNKLQIFIRQFFFILCTLTIIPLIVSIVISLFEKRGKTVHGYISMTRLIDATMEKTIVDERSLTKIQNTTCIIG